MARAAKTIKTTKPAASTRKAARSAAPPADQRKTAPASVPGKRTVADAASVKRHKQGSAKAPVTAPATVTKAAARVPAAPPAPKVSKDALRAQVEKLEQLVASLRGKSREVNKAAKLAAAHTLELEAQVAALEKKAAAAKPAPSQEPEPVKTLRAKRQGRKPGAAATSALNVATSQPAPGDTDADTTVEDLPASGERA